MHEKQRFTELRETQEALRASELGWRNLTEALPQLVWSAMPDGSCDYFSAQWTEHTGVPEPDLLGWRWLETLHPEDREPTRKFWLESVAEHHPYDIEYRVRRRDGEYRWFKTRGVPVRDSNGTIIKWFGTGTDITELRETQEALRQANARIDLAVRGSNIAIWECNMPDGRIENSHLTYTNAWESMGYDAATAPTDFPSTSAILFHPIDRERVMREIQELFDSDRQDYESEFRVRWKDGSTRWHLSRGTVLRDPEGTPVRFIGTSTDITDLKRAEEALRESEERFRGTFENAAVGIAHTHLTGRFLRVNETFCNIIGYAREELLQMGFQDITHPDDLAANINLLDGLIRGDSHGYTTEKRYLRKDGSPIWAELVVSLQRDAAGKPAYAIGVIQDISERKRLDAELLRAKEAAEAANRAKDEFLANVSHEIRTPMNAILGMTGLALDSELTEYQQQCLTTVKAAGENLLTIINDLLDFAKIEAGKLELDLTDFSLRSTVGETLRSLAVRAHKKGLELIYDVHPDVPDALVGDAGRLRQILINLVGNAIKFTHEGEVVVRLETDNDSGAVPRDAERVRLRFTVRDSGIGIPRDNQERIFRAFEQEDTSTTRKYGGTGLGLTISARLVALMDGVITVESEPSVGSTFAFTAIFSRQTTPTPKVAKRPQIKVHDLQVLVVDDNATNRRILEEWLQDWQMKPTAVGNGAAALDALLHGAASGARFELILLDSQMPEMDGLGLSAKIRALPELQRPRIILLTSGERAGDLSRIHEIQINAYLLKPIEQEQLLKTIIEVMSRADEKVKTIGQPVQRGEKQPANSGPLRVLVAEDNEFNAELLKQLLVRRGHQVQIAKDGRETLTAVLGEQFDLLLLDVHMPEMDGFQVAEELREHERQSGGHLPVIALTARSRKEDREQCLAAGMDDFLAKPIQEPDLWMAIDRHVGKQRSESETDSDLLTTKILLSACGRDAKILAKLCDAFKDGLPDYMSALRVALRNGEPARLRVAAHKLCGLLGTFSTKAGSVASQVEDLAVAARLEECRPLVDHLEQLSQDLLKRIDEMTIERLQNQIP